MNDRLEYTIKEMYRLAHRYQDDVPEFLSIYDLFDFVRAIPYISDTDACGVDECLKRPSFAVAGGDCDDKAIYAGAALTKMGIPWRFVTASYRPSREMQHVYLDVLVDGQWRPFDPTYPTNQIFRERTYTAKQTWDNPMMTTYRYNVLSLEGWSNDPWYTPGLGQQPPASPPPPTATDIESYANIAAKITQIFSSSQSTVNTIKATLLAVAPAVGAAIGSIIPGVGTVLGGAIGTVVGVIAGFIRGRTPHANFQQAYQILQNVESQVISVLTEAYERGLVTIAELENLANTKVVGKLRDWFDSNRWSGDAGKKQNWRNMFNQTLNPPVVSGADMSIRRIAAHVGLLAGWAAHSVDANRFDTELREVLEAFSNEASLRQFTDTILARINQRASAALPPGVTVPGSGAQVLKAGIPLLLVAGLLFAAMRGK